MFSVNLTLWTEHSLFVNTHTRTYAHTFPPCFQLAFSTTLPQTPALVALVRWLGKRKELDLFRSLFFLTTKGVLRCHLPLEESLLLFLKKTRTDCCLPRGGNCTFVAPVTIGYIRSRILKIIPYSIHIQGKEKQLGCQWLAKIDLTSFYGLSMLPSWDIQ